MEWIRTSDRVPSDSSNVLGVVMTSNIICRPHYDVDIVYMNSDGTWHHSAYYNDVVPCTVLYWCPIPELPELSDS